MSEKVTEWGANKSVAIATFAVAVIACSWAWSNYEANSSVRCDCRCHRCDDGGSGGAVLDSRANTGEARR